MTKITKPRSRGSHQFAPSNCIYSFGREGMHRKKYTRSATHIINHVVGITTVQNAHICHTARTIRWLFGVRTTTTVNSGAGKRIYIINIIFIHELTVHKSRFVRLVHLFFFSLFFRNCRSIRSFERSANGCVGPIQTIIDSHTKKNNQNP